MVNHRDTNNKVVLYTEMLNVLRCKRTTLSVKMKWPSRSQPLLRSCSFPPCSTGFHIPGPSEGASDMTNPVQ